MMQVIHFGGGGLLVTAPDDERLQGDLADPEDATFVFRHDAFCCVVIALGEKAGVTGHVEEPEHVAAGDGGDEGFLGVDAGWV